MGGCLGCLGLLLVSAVILVSLLYLEEDWRGASELAAVKARWQDAGYSVDRADYVPPPVPDDQNLAALPVFVLVPNPERNGRLEDTPLRNATNGDLHGGPLQDYKAKQDIATLVARAYTQMFPGKKPPASHVAQLEELYPLVIDLRRMAPTRPAFRLNQNYAYGTPWDRSFSLTVGQIAVAKLLSYHAQLALRENQPQVALEDIRIAFEIARGVGKDPSLVGGLVSVGVTAIARMNVDEGLAKHTWSDAQMAQLQGELKRIDPLTTYQFVMRAEFVTFAQPMYDTLKTHPSTMRLVYGMADDSAEDGKGPVASVVLWYLWASGWWDMNAAKSAQLMLRSTECVDPSAQRADVDLARRLTTEVEEAKAGGPAPWSLLYLITAGPMTNAVDKFVRMQVELDEDRIVCALERYRLAHGAYPATLDVLAPTYIDALPHDIINGESYHYRLNADGTFLLYSVGWNQVNDGGKIAMKPGNPLLEDYTQGDWVWPMVKK
jgi:hypothetical protein